MYTLLESVFQFCADLTGTGKHIDSYNILVDRLPTKIASERVDRKGW
jgi:hypothetical protein